MNAHPNVSTHLSDFAVWTTVPHGRGGTCGAKWRPNWKWSLTAAWATRSLNDPGSTWIRVSPLTACEKHLERMTAGQALLRDRGVTATYVVLKMLQAGWEGWREKGKAERTGAPLKDESRLEIGPAVAQMSKRKCCVLKCDFLNKSSSKSMTTELMLVTIFWMHHF